MGIDEKEFLALQHGSQDEAVKCLHGISYEKCKSCGGNSDGKYFTGLNKFMKNEQNGN